MSPRALWQRFCEDCRILWYWLRGKEEPEPTLGEMLRVTVPHVPEPVIDWFVWECEQYAKSPVFWHDHWRYAGTDLAYPEPTEEQRRKVWNASLRRAIEQYGEAAVREQGNKLAPLVWNTELEKTYFRQPDPWAWAMSQRIH
jgi:hypothetical protein